MNEIQTTDFRKIVFKRDTKVDYKNGNPIINCIFRQFDTDGNASFSDEEWNNYQAHLKKLEQRKSEIAKLKINDKAVNYYEKKLIKTAKEFEKLQTEFEQLVKTNYFENLLEFEEKHPNVTREGYLDSKELPKDAKKYDISAFKMGIFDETKKEFSDKCYEKGYLRGFETLSKDEQKEYLELLDNATKFAKKAEELEEKIKKLDIKYEKYRAMNDLARNGMINKIGSKEYEEQVYEKYKEIRSEANPFYNEIKKIEVQYSTLARKNNRTLEENKQLEQYQIQLNQLRVASENWSIQDFEKNINFKLTQGFQITDLSEKVVYTTEEQKITDSHSLGAMYSNENWSIMNNFTKEEKYTLSSDKNVENAYSNYLNLEYKTPDLNINSSISFSADNNSIMINPSVIGKYKNFGIHYSDETSIIKMEMPNENGEIETQKNITHTSTVGAIIDAGDFTNTANVSFAEEGVSYKLGSSWNFNKNFSSQKGSISLNPQLDTTYNQKNKTTSINPQINANFSYSNKSFRTNLNINENWNRTLSRKSSPVDNHNLTVSSNTSFKGFALGLNFNDADNSYSHSNTYGTSLSYNNDKAGRFEVNYSYLKNQNKSSNNNTESHTVYFNYSAPLEIFNKWFKKNK